MIDKAIAKITDEAMKIGTNFAIFLEEHLTSICTNDIVAAKLLAENKSLSEIAKKIESDAKAEANNGKGSIRIVGFPDAEIFRRLEEYYDIGTPQPVKAQHSKIDVFDIL